MNEHLRVKDGIITLPSRLRALWKGADVHVRDYGDRIALEGPGPRRTVDLKAWKKARGILKGRKMPDPLVWQRKIRREWERSLP